MSKNLKKGDLVKINRPGDGLHNELVKFIGKNDRRHNTLLGVIPLSEDTIKKWGNTQYYYYLKDLILVTKACEICKTHECPTSEQIQEIL